ncbi:MAG: ComEC/Rec2 family competence protein [Ferrovibrio sp.]|uniref:ComEC/Rec2 family competence protein n=1 Tax=Ferrovibrio sp. TaxID=1917215 RepID=UPI0039193CF7
MARPARFLLGQRVAAGLTAGWRDLRDFDAATCFLSERERWFLWLPALLGSGIVLYFLLPAEPPLLPSRMGIAAGIVVLLLALRRPPWHLPVLAAFAVCCGLWLAAERSAAVSAPVLQRPSGAVWLEGRVVEVEPRDAGHRLLLDDLVLPGFTAAETPQRLRITLRRDGDPLWPGDRIRVRAMLLPPPEPAMPGAFDFARYAWFRQIGGVGYAISTPEAMPSGEEAGLRDNAMLALSALRQDWTRRIAAQTEGAGGTIATALMTGVRGPIPDHIDAAFRDSGLAHVLSISGLHLTLVAGLLFFLVRAVLALSPALALRYPIKKWAAGVALLGALAYTLVSGSALPTLRALLMIALALLAVMLDRRAITLRAVAWAALLMLVLWPDSLLDPGFQMSFAAVTALVAAFEDLAPRLTRWRQQAGGLRIALLWLIGVMAASLVAGLGSSLFAAYHFNRVADYALIANLLAAPLVDFWIMPLVVLAFILMPLGLEVLALTPMVWGVDLLIALAQWVAGWPDAVGTVPAMPGWGLAGVTLGGLWLCLWRRRWRWLGVISICAGAASPWLAAQPDLLVSGDGRLLAARAQDGHVYFSSTPPRGFTAEAWWERLGAPPLYPWPALRRNETEGRAGADGSLRCDPAGCAWRHQGFLVAFPRQPQAIAEDCRHADAVIATQMPVRYRCPSARVVIDRNDLWRNGTHALYLDAQAGIRVVTVAHVRARRPWVIARGHGAMRDNEIAP